jgi:hypothetical protein
MIMLGGVPLGMKFSNINIIEWVGQLYIPDK